MPGAVSKTYSVRNFMDGRHRSNTVRVASVESGVRKAELARVSEVNAELTLHRAFCAQWP